MGNLFIYGCSFSYGTNVNIKGFSPNHPFYQNQFYNHYWGRQLANYYDMNLVERAVGGGANETALSRVLKDSSKYSKGDKVIIGITKGSRYSLEPFRVMDGQELIDKGGNPNDLDEVNLKENAYSDINDGIMWEYFRREKSGDIENNPNVFKNTFYLSKNLNGLNDEELGLLFHTHHIWRSQRNDYYEDFYRTMFQNLMGLLHRAGVEVYVWYWDTWGMFETITQWLHSRTNRKQRMIDGHWSPNGNTAFTAFAIEHIEQGVGYWNKQTVLRYKTVFDHSIFSKLSYHVDSNFEADLSWYDEKVHPWVKDYNILK